jgi:hypothetical protein
MYDPEPEQTLPAAPARDQLGSLPPARPSVYRPPNRRARVFWLGVGVGLGIAIVLILLLT